MNPFKLLRTLNYKFCEAGTFKCAYAFICNYIATVQLENSISIISQWETEIEGLKGDLRKGNSFEWYRKCELTGLRSNHRKTDNILISGIIGFYSFMEICVSNTKVRVKTKGFTA